jgi:hypothetical protein
MTTYRHFWKAAAAVLFATLFALSSCKKDDKPAPKASPDYKQYYPLKVGSYRIYGADSVRYSGLNNHPLDSFHFELEEIITSKFKDNTGNDTYKVERYRRADSSQPWQLVKVFTMDIDGQRGEWVENNSRYVKLVFPVEKGKTWNADEYNDEDSMNINTAVYYDAHVPFSNGRLSFDSVAVVEYQNQQDFITKIYQQERYASNVGLVQLQYDSLGMQHPDADTSKVNISGWIYKLSIIKYGP